MPNVAVLDMAGNEVGKIELNDAIFGIEPNAAVMHQMVVNYLANKRQGTQSTLTRAEVSGGGRKPWRQKGTGHARQGSIRAPQWRHGGIVFAPKPRSYRFTVNKKTRRLAMKSALSSKLKNNELIVLDKIELNDFKTKTIKSMLDAIGASEKALVVIKDVDKKIVNSTRNIDGAKTTIVNTLNVYDILHADKLVILKDAACKIEEVYA